MHARIDQLLSLRDGEPAAADVLRHVEACAACDAELQRLQRLREQLQTLPMLDAPEAAWQQISAAAATVRPKGVRARRQFAAAAAAVAVLSVMVAVAVHDDDGSGDAPSRGVPVLPPLAEVVALQDVAALVAQSRRLDDLFQTLPPRPSIERVATTATVDGLEARVQLVDLQLSYASDGGLDQEQARELWRERVDLMDSLVKVRYAEAGQISF